MNKSRRAVSEIIGSLVLLAITMFGGIIVWGLIVNNDVLRDIDEDVIESSKSAQAGAIKIIGFDTRDGNDLSGITSIDNDGDEVLTTGTDFIVVKIRNIAATFVFINNVQINEVRHAFTAAALPPAEGNFAIISPSAEVPFDTAEVLQGQDARLIIALDSSINNSDDIELTEGIRIDISASEFEFDRFIIPAGTAR